MEQVKDIYIHYEKAGDQFVVRQICGFSCLSTQSSVSLCYFDFISSENLQEENEYFNVWIKSYALSGITLPPIFFLISIYLKVFVVIMMI